jgi:hypothetical protein
MTDQIAFMTPPYTAYRQSRCFPAPKGWEPCVRLSRRIGGSSMIKRDHFPDPEVVDIHMLAGLANLTNRLTDPLGLELEFPEEEI